MPGGPARSKGPDHDIDLLRAAALASALFAAAPALADDAKPSDDPVVATVNGLPIHRSTLMEADRHSRLAQAPIEAVYGQLLDYVITSQLLLVEAKKANLADDPEVKAQMRFAQDSILEQTFIERKVASAVTDDAIKARYDETVKSQPGKEEVHARHILLDNEADAKQAIADIKAGAKFEDIAKAKSKGPLGGGRTAAISASSARTRWCRNSPPPPSSSSPAN